MSILYYIALRAESGHRGDVLFLSIQWIWFVLIPLYLIQSSIFNVYIEKDNKPAVCIIAMLLVILFNYKFYFREINQIKILKRYTYKYKIIDSYPISCFFISYFIIIFFGLYLSSLITKLYGYNI